MSSKKTMAGLVEYAKAQLGLPYWYGAFGQIGSYAVYRTFCGMYPNFYKCWSFESFTNQYGKRVHDCVGLIKGYLWSETPTSAPVYNAAQDKSANGMIEAAKAANMPNGPIETMPEKPGLLVHRDGHIGVYIGNGEVIEARGHAYGVIKSKLNTSEAGRAWTDWAQCPWTEEDAAPAPAPSSKGYTTTFKTIRRGDKGAEVLLLQKLLKIGGYIGSNRRVLELDGDFGENTEYALNTFQSAQRKQGNEVGTNGKNDGTCGPKCWQALLGV